MKALTLFRLAALFFSFAVISTGCGLSHGQTDPDADTTEPDSGIMVPDDPDAAPDAMLPDQCSSEPVALGPVLQSRLFTPGIELVSWADTFAVSWADPAQDHLRIIRSDVTREVSWNRGEERSAPAQVFSHSRGFDVVRATDTSVIRERYDESLTLVDTEIVEPNGTHFRAAEVGDVPMGVNLAIAIPGTLFIESEAHPTGPSSIRGLSWNGSEFLTAEPLGHGAWWLVKYDARGELLPGSSWDSQWSAASDYQGGSSFAPRAYEQGRHAVVLSEGFGDQLYVVIEGKERLDLNIVDGDASIAWTGSEYEVFVSGHIEGHPSGVTQGLFRLIVPLERRGNPSLLDSELVVEATDPSQPVVRFNNRGERGYGWIDDGTAYFLDGSCRR